MKISKKQLARFQQIYKQNVGGEIDDKTAYDLALGLLNLMKMVYKPIQLSQLESSKKLRADYSNKFDGRGQEGKNGKKN